MIKKLTSLLPFNYKRFWEKRYEKHKDILYCGHKGYTLKQNEIRIKKSLEVFFKVINKLNVDKNSRILDLGCGIGSYANSFNKMGFNNYVGYDLNKNIITELNHKYKKYTFEEKDLFKENITGKYDLIILISVAFHIIRNKHFKFLMNNIQNALHPNGVVIVSDILNINKRDSYYTKRRNLYHYKQALDKLELINVTQFTGGKDLIIFLKPF